MSKEIHFSSKVNNWIQSIGIILAGFWALYTFVYLQIYIPYKVEEAQLKKDVGFLNIDLYFDKSGSAKIEQSSKDAIALILHIKATNRSRKSLSIKSGYIQVWGDKIIGNTIENPAFIESVKTATEYSNAISEKYFFKKSTELVFVCSIFKNWSFQPGESAAVNRMIYLPKELFDRVEANAWVLSGPPSNHFNIKHKVTKDLNIDYVASITKNDKEILYNYDSEEFKELMIENKIGKSTSNCYFSLWND